MYVLFILTSDIISVLYEGTERDVRSSHIPDLYGVIQKVRATTHEKQEQL